MNVISFVLAIAAIVVFAARWKGAVGGHIGLGLALLTSAWVIQSIWMTTAIITFGK